MVVHAAAGGVGSIAVQLAKAWGAGRVIATASSAEKRDLALALGADVAVDSRAEDMTAALREANGGKRVDIVLDMTGGRVTDQSIAALAPFGRLAFYGMASRQQPKPVELRNLLGHSTAIAGMWLMPYCSARSLSRMEFTSSSVMFSFSATTSSRTCLATPALSGPPIVWVKNRSVTG